MNIFHENNVISIDFKDTIVFTKNTSGIKVNVDNSETELEIKNYTTVGIENRKESVRQLLLFLNVNKYAITLILLFIKSKK